MVPASPAATKRERLQSTDRRLEVVPDALGVHWSPSGLVKIAPPSPTATRCARGSLGNEPAVPATATRRSVEARRTCRTDQGAPSRLARTVPADPTAIKASPVQINACRSL